MKRKSISVIIAVMMVFAMMPVTAGAVFAEAGKAAASADDSSAAKITVSAATVLPADLSTTGDNDSGYKIFFDNDTAAGDKTYYLTEETSVTPTAAVYYQDTDGAYHLLAEENYDLKVQVQTSSDGDGTYDDAAFPLTYGTDNTAVYKISAAAKDGSGYTGETPGALVTVIKQYKITFDTCGGSSIDPQYVAPGGKVTRPEEPTKTDREFRNWYSDEDLKNYYYFNTEVSKDMTLYAGWNMAAMIGIYNKSNPDTGPYSWGSGTVEITSDYAAWYFIPECEYRMNYNLPESTVTLTAKPADGYSFVGWYEGVVGESHFVEEPSDTLVSDQNPYTPSSIDDAACLCAVFECAGHQWEQKTEKATLDADGRIYNQCSVCGTVEEVSTIPKISSISLEKTSFVYTGKAIEPKAIVTDADGTISSDNYSVSCTDNVNAGTATATVTFTGDKYEGSKDLTFTITKAANPLNVKGKTATVKYKKLKKKAQKLKVTKVIKFKKQGDDSKTYKLSSAKKGKKNFKKYFKINAKTGMVTVKKGLKKGTYKVKVKVKGNGNANYNASGWKTVTFKVKVK